MQPKYRKLYLALRAALAVPAAFVLIPMSAHAAEGGVATSYSWGNFATGNWKDPNWLIPGATTTTPGDNSGGIQLGDSATINRVAGSNVTYDATTGTRTIKNLIVGSTLNATNIFDLTSGSLTATNLTLLQAGGAGVQHTINVAGGTLTSNTTFTNSANANSASKVTVSNGGTLNTTTFNNNVNGANAALVNVSNGTLNNSGNFNNRGSVSVSSTGTLNGGTFINYSGATASVSGTGTLKNSGALGSNAGSLNITSGTFRNTGTVSNTGTLTNAGTVDNTGGILNNSATVNSTGSLSGGTITNAGTLNSTAGTLGDATTTLNQNGGTLTVSNGNTNSVGTLNITGGTTNLSGASSVVSVNSDYSNTGFGSGNTFNASAGVTGTGAIAAAGNAKQGLSVNAGATSNAANLTMSLGNVHVGNSVSQNYQVANTGTSGPSIRGAIQTVGTGNITDARLSGTGVAASNYTTNTGAGALATGASTANYGVTFNASTAGALSGQAVQVVDNFGDKQTLSIQGEAWRLASASAHTPEPVDFGKVHVNATVGQSLTLQNNASNDGFSEKLNASIGGATGDATASGSFTLLGAGLTNSGSLVVGLNTATAGAKSGTATIALVSDGQASGTSGNSGLGQTALTASNQTVNVQGEVWRLASASTHTPEPVNLGAIHVNQSFGTQALTIQNTASSDGYSEKLNASIGGVTGAASATGAFTLLGAQATDSTSLVVGLGNANTTTAGAQSGTATITLVSDGEASGTLGNSGLGTTALASQTVNVAGDVYNYANAAFEKSSGSGSFTGGPTTWTLDFGTVLLNSTDPTANLLVRNTPASSFTDLLGGNFTVVSGAGNFAISGFNTFLNTIVGGGALTGLSATLSTAIAGLFNEQIELVWDGFNASIGGGWEGTVDGQNTSKSIFLNLTGVVTTVPEPGILWLFGSAGAAAWLSSRRKKATKA